jgi:hypothetical protein
MGAFSALLEGLFSRIEKREGKGVLHQVCETLEPSSEELHGREGAFTQSRSKSEVRNN